MVALQLCVDLTEEIRNLHPRLHMEGAQEVVAIPPVFIPQQRVGLAAEECEGQEEHM